MSDKCGLNYDGEKESVRPGRTVLTGQPDLRSATCNIHLERHSNYLGNSFVLFYLLCLFFFFFFFFFLIPSFHPSLSSIFFFFFFFFFFFVRNEFLPFQFELKIGNDFSFSFFVSSFSCYSSYIFPRFYARYIKM